METTEGARIVRTPDDVRGIFEEVRSYFADTGVVNIVRTIIESRFVSDTEIESVHISRVTRTGNEHPVSTYPVFSVIKLCEDGNWRIAHSNYAITDSRCHGSALLSWRTRAKT
jgi:elongation factor P--beta-lysine ligase